MGQRLALIAIRSRGHDVGVARFLLRLISTRTIIDQD